MLKKQPKKWGLLIFGAKIALVAEAVCFAVSFGAYYRLNSNRDLRYYMYTEYPSILDKYYKLGELVDDKYSGREYDLQIWTQEGKVLNP